MLEIRAHLDHCLQCREELEELRALKHLLSSLSSVQPRADLSAALGNDQKVRSRPQAAEPAFLTGFAARSFSLSRRLTTALALSLTGLFLAATRLSAPVRLPGDDASSASGTARQYAASSLGMSAVRPVLISGPNGVLFYSSVPVSAQVALPTGRVPRGRGMGSLPVSATSSLSLADGGGNASALSTANVLFPPDAPQATQANLLEFARPVGIRTVGFYR